MKELRVAWFADLFDEVSGVVTDTIEMHSEALKRKIIWFPLTSYKKEIPPFIVFKPLLKVSTDSIYKGSQLYVPNFLSVINFLKKNKINVIVSNTPASMGYLAMASAFFLKLPWVDIYHTDVDFYMNTLLKGVLRSFKHMTALSFMKLYHKNADLIFVRNQDYYELMVKKGYPEKKIRYYPAGVDQERFNPKFKDPSIWNRLNILSGKKIVIFVGRISKVKDINFLLDYFNNRTDDKAVLLLVGEGPEYQSYKQQYGSNKNIYFLGVQKGEQLQKIYASADLSVLPSASETLGKTVLESMASGTPALTSDKGGPKDYVQPSVNGRIFKAGDYNDFCEKLNKLLSGNDDLGEMGRSASRIVARYTTQYLFGSFLNSLEVLLPD